MKKTEPTVTVVTAPMLADFLTVRDIKEYLHLSQSAAYTLTHRKDFPTCRFGGTIRIPRDAFLAWVDVHTRIPDGLATYMSQTRV